MKKIIAITIAFLFALTLSACEESDVITIGEGQWDSAYFHDQVTKIIIEEGYGIEVNIIPADTNVQVTSLKTHDINLSMELWSNNVTGYEEDIANGDYVFVSTNFDDNAQGLYIPAYLQEEYPELDTVQDLLDPTYAALFPDPEDSSKSIIYGGTEGWSATVFLNNKMTAYGLDELYNFNAINSTAALNASLASAYQQEEPWVGYNWEPTWVLGVYDMVLLEDSPYNADDFDQGIGAFPTVDVNVVVDNEFEDNYPEVFQFLQNYQTSSAITGAALAYMNEQDADAYDAAVWFLLNNTELWQAWVTEDAATAVMDAIQ